MQTILEISRQGPNVPPAPDNKCVRGGRYAHWDPPRSTAIESALLTSRVYKQTVEYVTEFTNADPNTAGSMRA